jgi:hypothetical protein
VDNFFKTLVRLASTEFSHAKSENNLDLGEEESVKGQETCAKLANELSLLLAKP